MQTQQALSSSRCFILPVSWQDYVYHIARSTRIIGYRWSANTLGNVREEGLDVLHKHGLVSFVDEKISPYRLTGSVNCISKAHIPTIVLVQDCSLR